MPCGKEYNNIKKNASNTDRQHCQIFCSCYVVSYKRVLFLLQCALYVLITAWAAQVRTTDRKECWKVWQAYFLWSPFAICAVIVLMRVRLHYLTYVSHTDVCHGICKMYSSWNSDAFAHYCYSTLHFIILTEKTIKRWGAHSWASISLLPCSAPSKALAPTMGLLHPPPAILQLFCWRRLKQSHVGH